VKTVHAPGCIAVTGYSAEEFAADPYLWFNMVFPEDRDRVEKYASRILIGKNLNPVEHRIRRKDGRVRWVLNTPVPHHDSSGALISYDGLISDITLRKRAEDALQESEALFRNLLQDVQSVSVQGYGADGTTQYWNKASELLYGYSTQEAIGRNLLDLIIPQEMRGDVEQAIQQMAETGQPIQAAELSMMRKDGSRVSVYSSHAVVQIPGHAPQLFCIDIDLTESKRAEEKLRSLLKEKDMLLHEVHHRVKNNLAVIIALFDLQKQTMEDPNVRSAFQDMNARIQSMALVHETLHRSDNLARIDFQEYLLFLIADICSSFDSQNSVNCLVSAAGIKISLEVAVPLGLMVNELVINALKHAFPTGRPRPGVSTCEIAISMEMDGDDYKLVVADNGVGIPADFDFTTSNRLGLRIVRTIGEYQLGGRIELDRKDGTRFTVTFDIKKKDKS